MWIRIKETGASEFVIDLARAFALIDSGDAEAVGDMPERPVEPDIAPAVKAPPKPRKAK